MKNFSNHHNELKTYVSLSRSSNSINPPSQFLFLLQFRSFLRERLNESRKSVDKTGFGKILFLEASRVEEFEEVQLNSTGPRKMAEVEGGRGVVYAVLSDPITSLSSFFPSGSGIRDRALFKRGVSAKPRETITSLRHPLNNCIPPLSLSVSLANMAPGRGKITFFRMLLIELHGRD